MNRLFHAALEREPDERAALIAHACDGDETLREEVESLVASHEQASRFIESPAADIAAELLGANHDSSVGRIVGPYRIVDLLGTGGMGEVYLAEDTRLGRRVALKLLPAQFTADEDRLRRFEREARAASALNHPNILVIYDTGKDGGSHFIATEFVEGETLRRRLNYSRVSPGDVVDMAVQVTSALAAAHKAGIIHRDLKPENIMLRPDGYIKLLDFGLAKLTESQAAGETAVSTSARVETRTGLVLGTVTYMSPEQARGLVVDARSDIFSFGIVLYEMITGRVPFDGETASDVIVSLLEREPPPLRQLVPDVPHGLERICTRLLAKNREDRYQTAKDVLVDLTNVKQELEVRGRLLVEAPAGPREAALTERIQRPVETDGKPALDTGEVTSPTTQRGIKDLSARSSARRKLLLAAAFALLVLTATVMLFLKMNNAKPALSDAGTNTIAVLPFKPLAADSRNESLELGMADTLINKLSGIRELIVRPLGDVRRYIRLDQDPIAAGRELAVNYVLEGNLQMQGDRTRATMRLLSVKDGSAVWTDKCDEQCSNVFELQDAIAERIAVALALKLSGEEKKQLAKHYTESPEAYQFYTLGVSEPDRMKKVEYFERAINIDPNYALAYRAIWGVYFTNGSKGLRVSKEERQKAERDLLKAAQLDETLPEVHASLGNLRKYYWDWAGAEREYERALELDPNSLLANMAYYSFLLDIGRTDEAMPYAKRVDQLVPGTTDITSYTPTNSSDSHEAYVYLYKHEYHRAIKLWLKRKKTDEPLGSLELAEAYLASGMYPEALAEMEKAVADDKAPERWDRLPILAFAYAVAGRREDALKILEEQKRLAKQGYMSPYNFAIIYMGLGDKDKAFEYLNQAFDEHAQPLYLFPHRPMFDSLHSDPRYTELLRKMNLSRTRKVEEVGDMQEMWIVSHAISARGSNEI